MLLWQKLLAQTLAGLKDATRSFEQAIQRGQAYGTHTFPSREGSDLACMGANEGGSTSGMRGSARVNIPLRPLPRGNIEVSSES